MKLSVTYFGQIKAAIGLTVEELEVANGSVTRLIEAIAARHGPDVHRLLLDDNGAPRASLMVIINDEQWLRDDPTVLETGDRVTLLPPISGGCPW